MEGGTLRILLYGFLLSLATAASLPVLRDARSDNNPAHLFGLEQREDSSPANTPASETLQKRRDWLPYISDKYTPEERQVIIDALDEVIMLCRAAVIAMDHQTPRTPGSPENDREPATSPSRVFKRYFLEEDKPAVRQVFLNILGVKQVDPNVDWTLRPSLSGGGLNPILKQRVRIVEDHAFKHRLDFKGKYACDDIYSFGWTIWKNRFVGRKKVPEIVLCPRSFALGGIELANPNENTPQAQAKTCTSVGDRITFKMYTVGMILLHELTHLKALVAPPLKTATVDIHEGTGPLDTLRLPKGIAIDNADSYAWYAATAFWTMLCDRKMKNPAGWEDLFLGGALNPGRGGRP